MVGAWAIDEDKDKDKDKYKDEDKDKDEKEEKGWNIGVQVVMQFWVRGRSREMQSGEKSTEQEEEDWKSGIEH